MTKFTKFPNVKHKYICRITDYLADDANNSYQLINTYTTNLLNTWFVRRVIRRVSLVDPEQELFTILEFLCSPQVFSVIDVAQSLVFYIVFCRRLFIFLLPFWPFYCLFVLVTPLVSLSISFVIGILRGYHTLQGDNSLKSVARFDHMMFVCRFQASRWSKPQREKLLCG
jgi:hypothetical protein